MGMPEDRGARCLLSGSLPSMLPRPSPQRTTFRRCPPCPGVLSILDNSAFNVGMVDCLAITFGGAALQSPSAMLCKPPCLTMPVIPLETIGTDACLKIAFGDTACHNFLGSRLGRLVPTEHTPMILTSPPNSTSEVDNLACAFGGEGTPCMLCAASGNSIDILSRRDLVCFSPESPPPRGRGTTHAGTSSPTKALRKSTPARGSNPCAAL
mmetsp:Transcript_29170/g.46482  ORF Transcript_29170/g.46482 Transcript_29170/m.46482 type:complete len:210 (+) Transcript_29170:150-779(+)